MTVAELLTGARQAHRGWLTAKKNTQPVLARTQLEAAQSLRRQAHDADLEHTDPAWVEDAKSAGGLVMRDRRRTVEQIARDTHDNLLQFYQAMLDDVAPVPMVLTEPEILARVTSPRGMAVEECAAFMQATAESKR